MIEKHLLKANDYFGMLAGPVEHKQHPNQQAGLDLYVNVLNFDTGERCFKKLYKNDKGLFFKHSGYPPSYLDEMTQTVTYIPYQIFDGEL